MHKDDCSNITEAQGGLEEYEDDSIVEVDVEPPAAAGNTRGCNSPVNDRFCPDGKVTRAQGRPAANAPPIEQHRHPGFEGSLAAILPLEHVTVRAWRDVRAATGQSA